MKQTKKVISIILAVLMVLTTVPTAVWAATVNSKEDSALAYITQVMELYENKMDGTVYTNMANAYNAYVEANRAYDAYVYGDAKVNLDLYASNLQTAMSNMTEFKDPVANATVVSRDTDTAINSNYATNLIYAEKQSVLADEGSKQNVNIQIVYSANTIALYTGATIRIPVFCFWLYDQTGFSSRKVFALYPTESGASGRPAKPDNANFQLTEAWHGSQNGTGDWNGAWSDGSKIGCYKSTIDLVIESSQNNRNKWNRAANYLTYVGGDTGFSNGLKTVSPSWYGYTGYSSSNNLVDHYMNNVGNIYVIDYKSLATAMAANKSKLNNVENAKQGGLGNVISAYDAAINAANAVTLATPANVSTVANNLYNAGNQITASTFTADNDSYQALRDAIDNTRATYNSTSSDKYTTESWNAFVTAFDNAKAIMADLPSTGYNNANNAKAKADALVDAESKLEVNFVPADVAEMIMIIDDASVAIQYKNYFTASTWAVANFEELIPAAKIAIWGSEASYKDTASIQFTADEQEKVAEWQPILGEGIMQLEINKDAAVSSAKGYSMNSAIAYAATFKAEDYANYSAVSKAVNEANNFYNKITDRNVGAVAAKVNEYRTDVENIIKAINALQPAFSKLANATVANAGSQLKTRGKSRDESNVSTLELSWIRNTDQIFFRTAHDATDFDLGGSTFEWITDNDTNDYDNVLDSINISSSVPEIINLTNKNLTNNDWGLDTATLANYPGGLRMSSGTGTISVKNLHVVAYNGSGDNWYVDRSGVYHNSDDADITDLLSTSEGTAPATGGVISHAGTTTIKGDYILTLPKTTKKSLTASTVPTMTICANSNNLGFLHHYKFYKFTVNAATEGSQYKGYSYGIGAYEQKATVVDISTLMDLFEEVKGLNEYDYTIDSWSAFETALENAKADMDYGHMTAEAITEECVARYKALFNAWKALKAPLTNTSIEEALGGNTQADALASAMGVAYSNNNANEKYTASTYAAFKNAYATAYAKLFNNGEYSDANIRNIANTAENQALVDSYATAVTNAWNALQERVDLSAMKAAIANISIENNKYTVDSLNAVATALNALEYAKLSDNETAELGKADYQAAIDAEVAIINSIPEMLVEGDVSALEAVKDQIKDQVKDPDAWDVKGANDYIDSIIENGLYDDVTIDIFKAPIVGIKYTTDDADEIVTEALTKTGKMVYTVYVDGEVYDTYEYGDSANVKFDATVDIFYAYISKVAGNVKLDKDGKPDSEGKFFTTDKEINFVVKGDTYLTTHKATADTTTHKVTYVNDVTGRIIAVDYVEDGQSVESLPNQPVLPFYTANGYVLDGVAFTATTPINKDITVTAMYAPKVEEKYTVYYTGSNLGYEVEEYERAYNGVVTFYREDAVYWAGFENEDDFNVWLDGSGDIGKREHIMYFGNTYSFRVHENAYVVSLNQEDLEYDIEAGFIDADHVGLIYAKSTTQETNIQTDEKLSIISTYVLPPQYELVEVGLLFAKSFDAELKDIKEADNENVYRLKSTKQTEGNQFVISIVTENIEEGQKMKYAPYVIYRDKETEEEIIYISPDSQKVTFSKTANNA